MNTIIPNDNGPIYKETLTGGVGFLIEPWNALSNLFFLFIVIYWIVKIYKNYKQQRFLVFVLPVLFIGFVGGTMYHGTRSSNIWIFMDWVPIMVLSFAASIFFAIKSRFKFYFILAMLIIPFTISYLVWQSDLPHIIKTIMGYPVLAFIILFPIVFYLIKTKWRNVNLIIFALFCFVLAIFFRTIDNSNWDIFYMGTHWLWHIFGATSSHFFNPLHF